MKTLTAKELKRMRDRNEDMALVNVLSEQDFDEKHIPGSANVPLEQENFAAGVQRVAGDKGRPVVVYCASRDCPASEKAAKKLEQAGFTNVMDFEDGVKGWEDARFPLITGERSRH